jgi:hypothetical protein
MDERIQLRASSNMVWIGALQGMKIKKFDWDASTCKSKKSELFFRREFSHVQKNYQSSFSEMQRGSANYLMVADVCAVSRCMQ